MVTTERAKHFYSPQDIPVTLYSDADEWEVSVGVPWAVFYHVSLPIGQDYPPAAHSPGGWNRQARLKSAVRAFRTEAMRKTAV